MISFPERLAACEKITEWLDPNDTRLVAATGDPVPNGGGNVREPWQVENNDEEIAVAHEVRRLLIPDESTLRGVAKVAFTNTIFGTDLGVGTGNVIAVFDNAQDWADRFPTDRARIFNREGRQAWAAVALCGSQLGLAVFAIESTSGGVDARVQVVPDDVFEAILAN